MALQYDSHETVTSHQGLHAEQIIQSSVELRSRDELLVDLEQATKSGQMTATNNVAQYYSPMQDELLHDHYHPDAPSERDTNQNVLLERDDNR